MHHSVAGLDASISEDTLLVQGTGLGGLEPVPTVQAAEASADPHPGQVPSRGLARGGVQRLATWCSQGPRRPHVTARRQPRRTFRRASVLIVRPAAQLAPESAPKCTRNYGAGARQLLPQPMLRAPPKCEFLSPRAGRCTRVLKSESLLSTHRSWIYRNARYRHRALRHADHAPARHCLATWEGNDRLVETIRTAGRTWRIASIAVPVTSPRARGAHAGRCSTRKVTPRAGCLAPAVSPGARRPKRPVAANDAGCTSDV